MLIYHDHDKILWIDLDAYKKFGFGAVVFHTSPNKKIAKKKMPFQIFLVANSIFIPPSHPSQEKLLVYRARDSGLCMSNTESLPCR